MAGVVRFAGCMPFVKVASGSELAPDSVLEVMVAGVPYAICNVAGKISGLAGVCPHRGGPLGQGAINGPNVVCPWHAWEWNCTTGENDMDSSRTVAAYNVRVEDGEIYLSLPD
jgi:nitrite reductase (NADH) small subunit